MRFSPIAGKSDLHLGGVALGDGNQGNTFQLWSASIDGTDIVLSAPNTPPFALLSGISAVWVALAFDQSAREFVAYADASGNASYYWYDSTIPGYRTSAIPGTVPRVFAALDDSRPQESSSSDVILAYVRSGALYFRAQRDRFGVEYDLGPVAATLVQVGMNNVNRFQFALQNVQGGSQTPPAEYQLNAGGVINVAQ